MEDEIVWAVATCAVMHWLRVKETPWAAGLMLPAAPCSAEPGDLILGPSCWEEQTGGAGESWWEQL